MSKAKIIVGMSGGVDSSVAALLLQQSGHCVEGLFMKNWEDDDSSSYCHAKTDLEDARAVCKVLNIPLHTANFSEEYWNSVFTHFLSEYKEGRTPNPDILCNREIKFKTFLNHAQKLGADFIATGHYAQKTIDHDLQFLKKASDPTKDQSYFLYALDQFALTHSLFPLAEIQKQKVRDIAKKIGFKNANKKDSTGICFIGERRFKKFLERYLPAQPGDIITVDGMKIGSHQGLMYYTLGQRQGLGIGGRSDASNEPWYVVAKNMDSNALIVDQGNSPLLYSNQLIAINVHWITKEPSYFPFECNAKARYRQPDQACEVNRINPNEYIVQFKEAQRAITPGQSIVFYKEDTCLGGGIIK